FSARTNCDRTRGAKHLISRMGHSRRQSSFSGPGPGAHRWPPGRTPHLRLAGDPGVKKFRNRDLPQSTFGFTLASGAMGRDQSTLLKSVSGQKPCRDHQPVLVFAMRENWSIKSHSRRSRREIHVLLVALSLAFTTRADSLPSVPTIRQPVTNSYHGMVVVDDYQWLEEAAAPHVREWTRLQNQRTRSYFSHLPYRDGLAQQLTQIRGEESARYYGLEEKKGRIFALRFKPPAQQPVLIRLSSLYPPALWKAVFDPNSYNTNGTTAIDW